MNDKWIIHYVQKPEHREYEPEWKYQTCLCGKVADGRNPWTSSRPYFLEVCAKLKRYHECCQRCNNALQLLKLAEIEL